MTDIGFRNSLKTRDFEVNLNELSLRYHNKHTTELFKQYEQRNSIPKLSNFDLESKLRSPDQDIRIAK